MASPILIMGFNRPAKLSQCLSAVIRHGKGRKIYIAIDGAREGNTRDLRKVRQCIAVVENYQTSRQGVISKYAAFNKGCKDGPIEAITWFFKHEKEGIILEDDCIPSADFFPYCDDLLDRYRNDPQIWIVAGDNSANLRFNHEYSYTFAPEPLIWGWATWSDRWSRYDADMKGWKEIRGTSLAEKVFRDRQQYETRSEVFNRVADGELSTCWDYQLAATVRIDRGLCIIPRHNLVTNIGFGEDATHTTEESNTRNTHPTNEIMPLYHPPCIFLDREVEQQIIEQIQGVRYVRAWRKRVRSARSFLVKMLKILR